MPFLYCFRPVLVFPKAIHFLEIVNLITAVTFDGVMYYFFGGKTVVYFVLSTVLGLSLHPISGHFIAEHYVFKEGHETYSYYGPLNAITYNVGYHNERKNEFSSNAVAENRGCFFFRSWFPVYTRSKFAESAQNCFGVLRSSPVLQQVRSANRHPAQRMVLWSRDPFSLSSWTKVLYDFVMDENVGPWSRITRPSKVGRVLMPSQQEYEQQIKEIVKQDWFIDVFIVHRW